MRYHILNLTIVALLKLVRLRSFFTGWAKYPIISADMLKKNDGIICLKMVLMYYRVDYDLRCIKDETSSLLGIKKAAEALGCAAKGLKGNPDNLARIPLPAIAHVKDENLGIYVVIWKVTSKQIILSDPYRGVVKVPATRFYRLWTGAILALVPGG